VIWCKNVSLLWKTSKILFYKTNETNPAINPTIPTATEVLLAPEGLEAAVVVEFELAAAVEALIVAPLAVEDKVVETVRFEETAEPEMAGADEAPGTPPAMILPLPQGIAEPSG